MLGDGVRIGDEDRFLALSDQHAGASTRSSRGELWSVHASLVVPQLQAETQVWLNDMDPSLATFFAQLAEQWRGWEGVKQWASYEGGLALACAHDGLGHIQVIVDLGEHSGGLGWHARAEVEEDAGRLDALATEISSFFR